MTLTAPPPSSAALPGDGFGELLRGVAAGERDCLASLYDRCADRVFGLLTRVVDPALAERVLVDVFDEVWRTARSCPAFDEAEAWILLIARRRAVVAARGSRS